METSLNKILAHGPCEEGWKKLLESLGKTEADNEPLPMATILESNGIKDAIWAHHLRIIGEADSPELLP